MKKTSLFFICIFVLSGCGSDVADQALSERGAVTLASPEDLAKQSATTAPGTLPTPEIIPVGQEEDASVGKDAAPADGVVPQKTVDAFAGTICATVQPDFWNQFFGAEAGDDPQKKRDTYFALHGYNSEEEALKDIESKRSDGAFQAAVKTKVDTDCREAFAKSGALFEEIFQERLHEVEEGE